MSVALVKIQVRNDLAQQWAIANPILSDGEPGAESDTGRLKIGNGVDRWLDLPYVGGGSGGGGNPLTGIIDGGVFTGSPSNIQCSAPSNPAASKIIQDGQEKVAISWGAAYPYKPDTTVILRYTVQVTQNPSDATSWTDCCESWPVDDPSEPPNNYAISPVPEPHSPTGSYWYRVQAVLSSGEDAEWGYTGEYRHFMSPVPTTFDLDPENADLGSNSETGDNEISILVTGLSGDVQDPIEWSYPEINGVSFAKDLNDIKLVITNTQGVSTPTQQFFVQCTINGVLRSATINLSNTISDNPSPNPPTDYLPVFEWELVEDEEATESLPIYELTTMITMLKPHTPLKYAEVRALGGVVRAAAAGRQPKPDVPFPTWTCEITDLADRNGLGSRVYFPAVRDTKTRKIIETWSPNMGKKWGGSMWVNPLTGKDFNQNLLWTHKLQQAKGTYYFILNPFFPNKQWYLFPVRGHRWGIDNPYTRFDNLNGSGTAQSGI